MKFKFDELKIGAGYPVFIIAEAGVNHNGSMKLAFELIDAAVQAGASAVKFQSFKAENIVTRKSPKATYHVRTTGESDVQSWYDLLKSQELSKEQHYNLFEYCASKNIEFMSTPYDEESIDLLDELGVRLLKVASTDTSNIPFLKYLASKKIPTILSSAMAEFEEVKMAVSVFSEANTDHAILQCTGNYPAKIENSNLRVIETYRKAFNCPVGYSDHTLEVINPIVATALGGMIYEKHFTLDKNLPGPDHQMSITAQELSIMVQNIRMTELSLGDGIKRVVDEEIENRQKLRKSLVAIAPIQKGEIISDQMIGIKRPAYGVQPKDIDKVIGKVAAAEIEIDEVITLDKVIN